MAGARRRLSLGVITLIFLFCVIAAPIIAGVTISLQNDAAARAVADRLSGLTLPPRTTLVDTYSQAGKLTGNGNGMQYLGAMVIRSDLSGAELKAYYDEQASLIDETRTSEYPTRITVTRGGGELNDARNIAALLAQAAEPGQFIVYMWGDAPSPIHEEFDLRGH